MLEAALEETDKGIMIEILRLSGVTPPGQEDENNVIRPLRDTKKISKGLDSIPMETLETLSRIADGKE